MNAYDGKNVTLKLEDGTELKRVFSASVNLSPNEVQTVTINFAFKNIYRNQDGSLVIEVYSV